jgi:transcriptional regulator with XRE-family HTH domain
LITGDHARGLTQAQIASAYGIHVQTVRRHLAKAGIPTRRSPLSGDQLEEAKRLRADGWSLRALGDRYAVAHTTVARLIQGR